MLPSKKDCAAEQQRPDVAKRAPPLAARAGYIVFMDNLATHRVAGVTEAIEAADATVAPFVIDGRLRKDLPHLCRTMSGPTLNRGHQHQHGEAAGPWSPR